MIPTQISLYNFMCYRERVSVSLEGIHLACICGDNGHGKSALLDAMTWALWGRARARTDDELISQGRSDMEVELEFLAGTERYRVIRKRTRGVVSSRNPQRERPGQSLLELQVSGEGVWRPLTGNSQHETQRRLQDLLRMDYQTFINSAFLLQGRADEFTVKRPAERKQVLADILGLSLYDGLEERARAEVRERDSEVRRLAIRLEELEREVAKKPAFEEEERQLAGLLRELEGQVRAQEDALEALRRSQQEAQSKLRQRAEAEERLGQFRGEIARSEGETAERQKALAEHEALLSQREEIQRGYEALGEARRLNDAMGQAAARYAQLTAKGGDIERRMADARARLQAEEAGLAERSRLLQARVEGLAGLKAGMEQAAESVRTIETQEASLRHRQSHLQEVAGSRQRLESERTQLQVQIDTLKDKVKLLKEGDARCPLCESDLGNERLHLIEDKYKAEGRESVRLLNESKAELERLKREEEAAERAIAAEEQRLRRERVAAEARLATLQRDMNEAGWAQEDLADVAAKLGEVKERLARGDFAVEEQAALADVLEALKGLSYDAEQHGSLRRRLVELEPFDGRHRRLLQAEVSAQQEREYLARAEEARARWQAQLQAEKGRLQALVDEMKAMPDYAVSIAAAQETLEALQRRRSAALRGQGEVREKLERCRQLEEEKREKLVAHRRAAEEKYIYDELASAFGKKGIQALLIEAALPEIEEEANRLLGLMTDNCMSVKIETQRDTKAGDTVETLDIKIADESGMVRSYELFSGGEAFRINLSLRIALSKLLARRAGAPLPTLVVDEGFGSQDASGRDKLVEAINSIRDDFQRILVITHIDELKDAFPVRITVTKTAEGSRIAVY